MDTQVVVAAQAGERAALAAIVDEFMPTVLGAAYGLCGDWHTAGDVAQETFATMLVRLGDLRDPAALPGWLMAVVRSSARRQRPTHPTVVYPAVFPSASSTGPEEIAVARDDARRVRQAVEELPPELRLPMVLHYFAAQPLAQIAELCDLPLSTIKKRMRLARARLREGMTVRTKQLSVRLGPEPRSDPSDAIRMYTAIRSGDVTRVAALLDARPELVEVRENWTRDDGLVHRLPWTNQGGTPLLRAVERGDGPMVSLLLSRGADPNGGCTCAGGESPLWVAAAQRETEILDQLLQHGADPNPTAFAGASALDVAHQRSYDDIASMLVAGGATSPSVDEERIVDIDPEGTGIKAIDLWCPFPTQGLVHLTPGFGLGAVVLIGELSYRAAMSGRRVVWTGFSQAPTDLGDLHHALAEADLRDRVTVSIAPPTATVSEQLAALERGVALANSDAFLVIFSEAGRLHAVDEYLPALSKRQAVTLVVAPLDGSATPPPRRGTPYLASIEFDSGRARRGLWPAISSSSWSRVEAAAHTELAARARATATDALDQYLAQPFYIAEHITGRPGQYISLDALTDDISSLVSEQS